MRRVRVDDEGVIPRKRPQPEKTRGPIVPLYPKYYVGEMCESGPACVIRVRVDDEGVIPRKKAAARKKSGTSSFHSVTPL